jgi:putative addiction module antidote
MTRKIFRSGNSLAVTLPPDALEHLGIEEGSRVEVFEDAEGGKIVITPAAINLDGVDAEFIRMVDEFIEEYRPTLEALAKR